MDSHREKQLKKNMYRMFWIRSFLNIKVINVVLSLFYVSRGLSTSQIMYVLLFWAFGSLIFEIPSSYLADRWGRKKTLILGIVFCLLQWITLFFAQGFWWIALAIFFYGLWSASFSGTDIALIYDTKRELGAEDTALGTFGKYDSAMNIFKVGSTILGAFIAQDLLAWQFQALIAIDIVATCIALVLAFRLVEPNHRMDLEKLESGILLDAANIFRKHPYMFKAILNQELVFLSGFAIWTYFQVFYVGLGLTVMALGIGWSIYHFLTFIGKIYVAKFFNNISLEARIDFFAAIYISAIIMIVVMYHMHVPPLFMFACYVFGVVFESLRRPLFNQYFNQFSNSFNRATTLSLKNLMHNVLEFPILIFAGIVLSVNEMYPYYVLIGLGIFTLLFLRVPKMKVYE